MGQLSELFSELSGNAPLMANRWELTITPPPGPGQDFSTAGAIPNQAGKIWARSVSLPGVGVLSTQETSLLQLFDQPYAKQYEAVSVTFLCSKDMQVWRNLMTWIDAIGDPMSNVVDNYVVDLVGEIKIDLHDNNDPPEVLLSVVLKNAMPTSVSPINLTHEADTLATFDVTFAFQYWEISS